MAGVKHKPESGGIRRNYFRMDGSDGKEMRKVFVIILSRLGEKQEEQNTDAGGENSQQEEFQGPARLSP